MGLIVEPYNLDPDFERVVLYLCAHKPGFWSLVGYAVDPDSVEVGGGKLLLDTIRQIAKELGSGPASTLVVVQRLRRRVHEGKVTVEQVREVCEIFDAAQDCDIPEDEAIVNELLPVLKRKMHSQAILMSHKEFAAKGDFSVVTDLLERTAALGTRERIAGSRLGVAGFDVIERAKVVDRLPTGVLELDLKFGGGLPRKSLGLWVGDSGGGKSIALASQAGECVRRQMFTGFVTLELPEHVQMARLLANISGVPTNDILDIEHWKEEAKRRVGLIEHQIGVCELAEFAPHATTVQDLVDWVEDMEQRHGGKMECLIVDYADKLYAPKIREDNQYLAMRVVYEDLRRLIAMARDMWVWTASQASRPSKDSAKKIDMHHVADSMHKARIVDAMITLNPREDEQMEAFVAKYRLGISRYMVGPFMTDFARARLSPVTRELGPW